MVQVRLLAALWRQISPADREACVAIASADRDRWLSALLNLKTSIVVQKRHSYTGYLKSETPGDVFLPCGNVVGHQQLCIVFSSCSDKAAFTDEASWHFWTSTLSFGGVRKRKQVLVSALTKYLFADNHCCFLHDKA